MKLQPGFVVAGGRKILCLSAEGAGFRRYVADSDAGLVDVTVARHESLERDDVDEARTEIRRIWSAMRALSGIGFDELPLPLELVHMYPGDPAVRAALAGDVSRLRREPYIISRHVSDPPLQQLIADGSLDDQDSLDIALRIAMQIEVAHSGGISLGRLSADDFSVNEATRRVTLTNAACARPLAPDTSDVEVEGAAHVPTSYGRILTGMFGGATPPDWPINTESHSRWRRLLVHRRVAPEYHDLILGCLGDRDEFNPRIDAVVNRLKALTGRTLNAGLQRHRQSGRPPLPAGTVFAERYELGAPFASGGRGFVYDVMDRKTRIRHALKANRYRYDSADEFLLELPTRRLELEHEYEVMARFAPTVTMIPQPVALVHGDARGGWFDLPGTASRAEPYLIMERLQGVPVSMLLKRPHEGYRGAGMKDNRLPWPFVLRLLAEVAGALTEFHRAGYLYQDLKSDNILYNSGTDRLSLVDFAALCPRDGAGLLDRSSVAFGSQTHGFAAPEFRDLWERVDQRFDVYSLGATAWHLLTGVNPERVAIETGEEYPTLDVRLLAHLPEPVSRLISACLAPQESRIPTAPDLAWHAEMTRLFLSRSRPNDVRKPRVDWGDSGATLSWLLPDDPRVSSVQVLAGEATVWEGARAGELELGDAPADDTDYLIRTGMVRRGERRHSRGVVVRVHAHPPCVEFSVTPGFAQNVIQIRVAPHADSVELRWQPESPPLDVDEGMSLTVPAGGGLTHTVAGGTCAHYTAWARYGDDLSAPRFATARARVLPESPGALRATQDEHRVRLTWERDVPGLVLCRTIDGVSGDIARSAIGRSVDDRDCPAGAAASWSLHAEDEGVRSHALAETSVIRWPARPVINATPGFGSVTYSLNDNNEGPERLYVESGGRRYDFEGGMCLLRVEPGTLIVLREAVGYADEAPVWELPNVAVPGHPQVALSVENDTLRSKGGNAKAIEPVTLTLSVKGAEGWDGTWTLRLYADGREVGRCLADGSALAAGVGIPHEGAPVGRRVEYSASVEAPDGSRVSAPALVVAVRRQLPAPTLTPQLDRIAVAETMDGQAVELRVDGVVLPAAGGVSCEGGSTHTVEWRLVCSDFEMPWSDASMATSLKLPDPPDGIAVGTHGDVVRIRWCGVGQTVEVTALSPAGERLVYLGVGDTAIDTSPAVRSGWRLQAIDGALRSEARVVTLGAGSGGGAAPSTSTTGGGRPVAAGRSAVGLPPPAARLACFAVDEGLFAVRAPSARVWRVKRAGVEVARAKATAACTLVVFCARESEIGKHIIVGTGGERFGLHFEGRARLVAATAEGVLSDRSGARAAGSDSFEDAVPEGAGGVLSPPTIALPFDAVGPASDLSAVLWLDTWNAIFEAAVVAYASQRHAAVVRLSVGWASAADLLVAGTHLRVTGRVLRIGRAGRARIELRVAPGRRRLRVRLDLGNGQGASAALVKAFCRRDAEQTVPEARFLPA